jgi:ABC-type Fe3+/spermidine/putrescine transport system ATPase subunit
MSAVEFRSVGKTYRAKRVIDSLSFMIEAGERVVLFGPSGCGKSTTLLLIAGLVAPDAGEIRLAGKGRFDGRKNSRGPTIARRRHGVSGSCALAPYERCPKHRVRTSRAASGGGRMPTAH